jgi:hypothetical protein
VVEAGMQVRCRRQSRVVGLYEATTFCHRVATPTARSAVVCIPSQLGTIISLTFSHIFIHLNHHFRAHLHYILTCFFFVCFFVSGANALLMGFSVGSDAPELQQVLGLAKNHKRCTVVEQYGTSLAVFSQFIFSYFSRLPQGI